MDIDFPIIFTHVPRSGGTTLNGILEKKFHVNSQFEFAIDYYHGTTQKPLQVFDQMTQSEKDNFLFLTGHVNFGLHEYYAEKCSYITLFRNPLTRIVSYFDVVANNSNHYMHGTVKDNSLDIESFLRLKLSAEFDNAQVRQLSGIKGVKPGNCTEDMLEKAIDNLDKFYPVFGITERYDESLIWLNQYFKFSNTYYTSTNKAKTGNKVKIDQKVLDVIRETNSLDLKFYEYALQKFEKEISHMGNKFEKDVLKFKKTNALLTKIRIGKFQIGISCCNLLNTRKKLLKS